MLKYMIGLPPGTTQTFDPLTRMLRVREMYSRIQACRLTSAFAVYYGQANRLLRPVHAPYSSGFRDGD